MQRRRTGRAIIAIVAVSILAMMATAVPASAIEVKKKVDITLTATNGCTYHVDGTTIWRLESGWTFVGTVTVSGGPLCNGIIQFDPASQRLQASLDTADDRSVSRVSWKGSERAVAAALNADEANSVISGAITKALGGA